MTNLSFDILFFAANRYAPEASGVACGLNWLQKDHSHLTYGISVIVGATFWYSAALVCVSGARQDNTKIVAVSRDCEWLNDRQLRWVSIYIHRGRSSPLC